MGIYSQINATSSSSGQMVLIQSQTASSSSSLTFVTGLSGYDVYYLSWYGVTVSNNGVSIGMQLSTNGGSSYINTGYNTAGYGSYSSSLNDAIQTNAAEWNLTTQMDNTANLCTNGYAYLYNFSNNALEKNIIYFSGEHLGGPASFWGFNGYQSTLTVINALQIFPSAGTFSGKYKLYGIQN